MADLDPLVKLRKHDVEERQKKLAELYRHAEELEANKKAVQDEMAREQELAKDSENANAMAYLGNFLQASRKRIEGIDKTLSVIAQDIDYMREQVREAYAEMKKVEIVQRNREEEERRADEKREADLLDEVAIESYRRNLEED